METIHSRHRKLGKCIYQQKKIYVVNKAKNLGENVQAVKLVSPAATTVEQAKASMKRYHSDEDEYFDLEKYCICIELLLLEVLL